MKNDLRNKSFNSKVKIIENQTDKNNILNNNKKFSANLNLIGSFSKNSGKEDTTKYNPKTTFSLYKNLNSQLKKPPGGPKKNSELGTSMNPQNISLGSHFTERNNILSNILKSTKIKNCNVSLRREVTQKDEKLSTNANKSKLYILI
jgi:hypothetical protein